MAVTPKASLLLGVLLAALFLISSHVADAVQEKQTQETATEAAGDTVIDSKQADAVCPRGRCCKWYRHGFGVRCVRCCADGEEATAEVAEPFVDNKQACPGGRRCCKWYRHGDLGTRCVRCCAEGEEVSAQVADAVVDNEQRACECCHFVRQGAVLRCFHRCCRDGKRIAVDEVVAEEPQN